VKGAFPTETVFDGALLRARLTRPRDGGRVLYVTFRQRLDEPGSFSDDPPVRQALIRGMAHLHLQSCWNDWYLNAETPALEAALRSLRAGFTAARAVGYSMGGYAALRLAAALDLTQALVISPQFTLDRHVIPEERRYREAADYDSALGDLTRHGKPDLQGVTVFDPSHPLDPIHARLIAKTMPGMTHAPCMFGGHPATQGIRGGGGFRTFQALGLEGDLTAQAVVRLHRQLRAQSSRYWHFRAKACLARGKTAAAEFALARAEVLAASETG
jgi:pimeloyl-ACP methyl ester carboxylesterase